MININGKATTAVYCGGAAIAAVYKGAQLVWSAINSCFGAGYWGGDKPWSDEDGWRHSDE